MDQMLGQQSTVDEGTGLVHRAVRLVLVAYLSPVILVVMAIGLVGMLAGRLARPVARPPVTGAHPAHAKARPLGVGRSLALGRPLARAGRHRD